MKGLGVINLKEKTKLSDRNYTSCHDLSITRSATRREKKSYDDGETAMTGKCLCASLEK
jgi:hypothetical protein